MTVCYVTRIAGFDIKLTQAKNGHFTVIYGKQTTTHLNYREAAMELGTCIMHALACEGKLNNS